MFKPKIVSHYFYEVGMSNKRISILSVAEIAELYTIPRFTLDQRKHFFSLNPNEEGAMKRLRHLQNKAYFILLLGYFRYKPIYAEFNLTDIKADLDFILDTHFSARKLPRKALSTLQKSRLYRQICQLTGYQSYDVSCQAKHAVKTTSICVDPRYVLDECIDYLAVNTIVVPKYTTIQDVVSKALSTEKLRTVTFIRHKLSTSLKGQINHFISPNESVSVLTSLKTLPKDFTHKELNKEIDTFNTLKQIYPEVTKLLSDLSLSEKNIEYYASLVDFYTITKLRRFNWETASLYVLCFIRYRYRQINDNLINAFIYHIRKLTQEASMYAKAKVFEENEAISHKMKQAGTLLKLFIDENIDDNTPFKTVRDHAFTILPKKDIPKITDQLANAKWDIGIYEWLYYDQSIKRIQGNIGRLFNCLDFSCRDSESLLFKQIKCWQLDAGKEPTKPIDGRLIKKSLKPYLYSEPKKDEAKQVIFSRYEVLLYKLVKDGLEAGLLFISDSQTFRSLADDLISDKEWENKDKIFKSLEVPKICQPAESLLADLEQQLEVLLNDVSERINNGNNEVVVFIDKSGKTKWRLPYKGVDRKVNNPFFEQLPPISLADLLSFVHQETGFLNAFTHIQPRYQKSKADLNNTIACIVANGTNYGLNKLASISDRSLDHLRTTQANFIRLETLKEANDIISNHTAALPIFEHYQIQNDRIHASSDGQKFECRLNAFKARYSSKYFNKNKGVSSVTMVANHVPINARLIGANEHESHYVFDLLYNNTSDIRPDVLSTDTHGTNQVNFALLDLFGYAFAPRYANFSKVISDIFSVSETNDGKCQLKLKKPIRKQLCIDEWDTIQKICVSLKQKKATQSTIVRKLSSYNRSNKTMQAFAEYDRLVKAIYLLTYIDDMSLRQYVQKALNRGEAYHQLRRAVASVNGNRFRGGSDLEMEIWNECARLITNGIITFNSIIFSKLLEQFESVEAFDAVELVKQLSPVAWIHINMNGTYSFSFEGQTLELAQWIQQLSVFESEKYLKSKLSTDTLSEKLHMR